MSNKEEELVFDFVGIKVFEKFESGRIEWDLLERFMMEDEDEKEEQVQFKPL